MGGTLRETSAARGSRTYKTLQVSKDNRCVEVYMSSDNESQECVSRQVSSTYAPS